MAESLTARLGLPRWTAGTDTLNRGELDGAMAALEANVPKYAAGVDTARPAAGAATVGQLYVHTSGPRSGAVDYSDGTTWRDLISHTKDLIGSGVLKFGHPTDGAPGAAHGLTALTDATAFQINGSSATHAAPLLDLNRARGQATPDFRVGPRGSVEVRPAGAGDRGMTVYGPANGFGNLLVVQVGTGHTASAIEVQNASGVAVALINAGGRGILNDSLSVGTKARRGANSSSVLTIDTGSAGNEGIVVRGFTGQTQSLIRTEDVNGALRFQVLPDGSATSAGYFAGNLLIAERTDSGRGIQAYDRTAAPNAGHRNGPQILSEGQTWSNTAGTVIQRGGVQVRASTTNVPTPKPSVAFIVNRPGSYDTPADHEAGRADENGLNGHARVRSTNMEAMWFGMDYNGNGVVNSVMRNFVADGNQISFQSDPAGDTGYRTLRAGGYSTVSTRDSKSRVRAIPGDPLAAVRVAKPVRFQPRDARPGEERDGFVAEELVDVYPQAVTTTPDGTPTGIDYGALTPLLFAGVQQLDTRLVDVERRLALVERRPA